MKKKFTLIELLVVIAVIAILASLLLPSLNRARDKAKTIACLSQQKQLGLAFFSYANENNDMMPPSRYSYWFEKLMPIADNKEWANSTGVSKVFVCPASINENSDMRLDYQGKKGPNYLWNVSLGLWGTSGPTYPSDPRYSLKKLSSCRKPSIAWVMIDGKANTYSEGFDTGNRTVLLSRAALRHGGNSDNFLHADGHSQTNRIVSLSDSDVLTAATFGYYGGPKVW